ncbi:hypothetical protein SAY86_032174 [Trapa natans]|uniref:Uncharacterized protein n=1 Tax=Trapa natans TaxID=22666 RepID=A0AAN7R910_TRANT|nr:hypothetical protein SAY86_032174 [Trapa natans]
MMIDNRKKNLSYATVRVGYRSNCMPMQFSDQQSPSRRPRVSMSFFFIQFFANHTTAPLNLMSPPSDVSHNARSLNEHLAMEDSSASTPSSPPPPNPSFRLILNDDDEEDEEEAVVMGARSSRNLWLDRIVRSTSTKDLPRLPPLLSPFSNLSPARHSIHASSSLFISPPHAGSLASAAATGDSGESDAMAKGRCVLSVLKKDGQISSMAISSNLVYSGTATSVIRVWKLPEFMECDQLRTRTRRVVAMAVSGFRDQVCAAYSDGRIRVWRRSWEGGSVKHARIATIPSTSSYVMSYLTGKYNMMKHMAPITALMVNTTGDILYSASIDTTVKVWRLSDFRCLESFQAHPQPVNALAAGRHGVLYTASEDTTVRVWRAGQLASAPATSPSVFSSSFTSAHSLILTLPAKNSPIKTLSLTAGSEALYGGGSDGCIYFWLRGEAPSRHASFKYGGALQGHTHAVLCTASVGRYVASGSADSTVRVWARDQEGRHECVALMLGHRGPVRCVMAYQEGMTKKEEHSDATGHSCTICSGSLDGTLKIWSFNNNGI